MKNNDENKETKITSFTKMWTLFLYFYINKQNNVKNDHFKKNTKNYSTSLPLNAFGVKTNSQNF